MHSIEIQVLCWCWWNWSNSVDNDLTIGSSCTWPVAFEDSWCHVSSITDEQSVVLHEVRCHVRDQAWDIRENWGPGDESLCILWISFATSHLSWDTFEKSHWVIDPTNNCFHSSLLSITDDCCKCVNHSLWFWQSLFKSWNIILTNKSGNSSSHEIDAVFSCWYAHFMFR